MSSGVHVIPVGNNLKQCEINRLQRNKYAEEPDFSLISDTRQ